MTIGPGSRLGPYEIVSLLGTGGMGEVWKARDTRLDRNVAIKILPADFAQDAKLRMRLEREARTLSQLDHPNICMLHDVGDNYLVMELVEGQSLADRLTRGPMPLADIIRYGSEVADALDRAHRAGVVHRDLKPGNIILTRSGAKLVDFGLAKGTVMEAGTDAVTMQKPLTEAGTILGTFQYISPEQLGGREADARSDIFALGAVLYEMATGTLAFPADSKASLIASILTSEPRVLSEVQPSLPPALDRLIRVCLKKDPEERWQSARDLAMELRWIAEAPASAGVAPPRSQRKRAAVAIAVAAVIITAILTAAVLRSRGFHFGPPVVVMLDSTHPERVYDDETRKRGGTNADDLTDLLNDLPVTLVKENTSWSWHRENEILRQNPDLILIHRSSFYVPSGMEGLADNRFEEGYFERAWDKLELFLGYIAAGNPRTKFVVYSRKTWKDDEAARTWAARLGKRFPELEGRVVAWRVPLHRETFRHPQTGAEFRKVVVATLGLE